MAADFESPPWNGGIVLRDDERDGFWTADISLPKAPSHTDLLWMESGKPIPSIPPLSSMSSDKQTAWRSMHVPSRVCLTRCRVYKRRSSALPLLHLCGRINRALRL